MVYAGGAPSRAIHSGFHAGRAPFMRVAKQLAARMYMQFFTGSGMPGGASHPLPSWKEEGSRNIIERGQSLP